MNLNNVFDCSTSQFVALFGVNEVKLYELYCISVKVHKVQAKNKVHKVRTSQLWLIPFDTFGKVT